MYYKEKAIKEGKIVLGTARRHVNRINNSF